MSDTDNALVDRHGNIRLGDRVRVAGTEGYVTRITLGQEQVLAYIETAGGPAEVDITDIEFLARCTTITNTGQDVRKAHLIADENDGFVVYVPRDELGLGGGFYAVMLDNAEGKRITIWSDILIPEGATLERRDSLRPGDQIISSHSGRRRVKEYDRGNLWLEGITYPERYDANSLIPVIERAKVTCPNCAVVGEEHVEGNGCHAEPGEVRATVDPSREVTEMEERALVTIETLERLIREARAVVQDIPGTPINEIRETVDTLSALLTEASDIATTTTCTHVKQQALSDRISRKARERVAKVREVVAPRPTPNHG